MSRTGTRRTRVRVWMTVAPVLMLTSCAPDGIGGPVVRVAEGRLGGVTRPDGVSAFLGVPFAAPPIGDRRWRPPTPPGAWPGVRDATRPAAACPQDDATAVYYRRAARRLAVDSAEVPGPPRTSEDCLYLNVWTPDRGEADLPVLVWIHGGAGTSGSASDPLMDGARLAGEGAVVVSVAYRLGALGFLAHPALSAERARGVSGNYGLLDLVRALEWIRDNASAFGGDPGRVTVAGQSAGATLAQLLLLTPAADGLIHGVIAHSGAMPASLPTLATAEEAGVRVASSLGLPPEADGARLRELPSDVLAGAYPGGDVPAPAIPISDGIVLPGQPGDRLRSGAIRRVPVLAGTNADEMSLLTPPGTSREDRNAMTRELFLEPTLRLVDAADGRFPVWLYRFEWRPDDGTVGAFHGVELPVLFGTPSPWWEDTPTIEELGHTMRRAWVRFAAEGSPAGGDIGPWPPATGPAGSVMVLDSAPRLEPVRPTGHRGRFDDPDDPPEHILHDN